MNKIFLGGTCAETTWRDELIPFFEKKGIQYFNPVVKNWTPECQAVEEDEKNHKCNIHLYVITIEMIGVYSIAEIIHSAHLANMYGTNVDEVIFAILNTEDWTKGQLKSLRATQRLVKDIAPHNSLVCEVHNMEQLFEQIDYELNSKKN